MTERRVTATPEALELIERLRARHGRVALFMSGGCCEGSAPMCVAEADLPPGPNDIELGRIAGAPFLIDCELDERWGRPRFTIDVAPGPGAGFSLDSLTSEHFTARS